MSNPTATEAMTAAHELSKGSKAFTDANLPDADELAKKQAQMILDEQKGK